MHTALVFLEWSSRARLGRQMLSPRWPWIVPGVPCAGALVCACAGAVCGRGGVRLCGCGCVRARAARVRVRVRVLACVRSCARFVVACVFVCVCVCACVCVCVAVRLCVCAGRRDDPPRLGRALLLPTGMLYVFTVGLRLGRQRI